MKVKLLAAGLSLFSLTSAAQSGTIDVPEPATMYNTAIGVRVGQTSGITVKHFFAYHRAIEGIIGLWHRGFSLTGLYEQHQDLGVPGLHWYYGLGGHVSVTTYRTWYRWNGEWWVAEHAGAVGVGVDGILGIEWKIPPIPLALSLDVKPFVEVTTAQRVNVAIDPGLGLKVAF